MDFSFSNSISNNRRLASFNPKSIAGYLGVFDTITPSRIKNNSNNNASVGETVKRWESDNPLVYFTQSTVANQPQYVTGGVRSIDLGDTMVSSGIGTTEGRTVFVIYSDVTAGAGSVSIFDGNSANSFYLSIGNVSEDTSAASFNYAANVGTLVQPSFYSDYATIAVARKATNKAGLYSGKADAFSNNLSYAGTRASTALNLFSKGSTGAAASVHATIVAMVIYDGYISDSDSLKVIDWMRLKYTKYTPNRIAYLYDIWGQSNASGRADTTGVTDFNSISTSNALMVLGTKFKPFVFGSTHNLGCDSTLLEFGSESELLRLATLNGNLAAVCKYGQGGTGLYNDWLPTSGSLYIAAFNRTREAASGLKSTGFKVSRKGLIWIQGEKDAQQYESTNYSSRLQTLVANYRAAYGSSIPVAVVKIKVPSVTYPDVVAVQAAQASAVTAMGNAILIDTTSDVNFPQIDGVHFSALGQKNIAAAAFAFFESV